MSEISESFPSRIIAFFDKCKASRFILYREPNYHIEDEDGVKFQFLINTSIAHKPLVTSESLQKGGYPNPFDPPESRLLILDRDNGDGNVDISTSKYAAALRRVAETHSFLLNKYCVCRPQLLLTTRAAPPEVSQDDDLNLIDLIALYDVFAALGEESNNEISERLTGNGITQPLPSTATRPKFLAFYNCGPESGRSQPHKHIQIMPSPALEENFDLFPEQCLFNYKPSAHPFQTEGNINPEDAANTFVLFDRGLPYVHCFFSLPALEGSITNSSSERWARSTQEAINILLNRLRRSLPFNKMLSYNLVLTARWVLLVPRRRPRVGEPAGLMTNAAGMLGQIWAPNEAYAKLWKEGGIMRRLCAMAYSWDQLGSKNRKGI